MLRILLVRLTELARLAFYVAGTMTLLMASEACANVSRLAVGLAARFGLFR